MANKDLSDKKKDIDHAGIEIRKKSSEHDRVHAECSAMCFDQDELSKLEAKAEQLKKDIYSDVSLRNPDDITSEIENKRGDLKSKQRVRDRLKDELKFVTNPPARS